jgi:predicted ribosome quality control (RQC) complex YloA/Tae2 family protein
MKGMNHLEIKSVVEAFAPDLEGGRVQRIFVTDAGDLVFDIRVPGQNRWLLIGLDPVLGRIHEIPGKPQAPQTPPRFCMALRKQFIGAKVVELSYVPGDRIVALWVERGGERAGLIAEIFGPAANAFVLNTDGNILDVLYPKKAVFREQTVGASYLPPEIGTPKFEATVRDFGDDLAAYFINAKHQLAFDTLYKRLNGPCRKQIKRGKKYISRMQKELESLTPPDHLRKFGDILSIHLSKVQRGMDQIELPDIYEPGQTIAIPLDPKMDGPRNAQRHFKTARKNERKIVGMTQRIGEMESRQLELMEFSEALESASSIEQLENLVQSATGLGLEPKKKVGQKKRARQQPKGPMEFTSKDGVLIMVGRNAKQNDELTFRIAKGNDYWLHALGQSGSHIVIRAEKSASLKQETLLDAATLAIVHSKLSRQGKGEVTYTQRKYVTKPKGAPPGRVTHSQGKTVYIKVDQKRVDRLFGNRKSAALAKFE